MERNTKWLLVNILTIIALLILGVYFYMNNSSQWLNIILLCLYLLLSLISLELKIVDWFVAELFSLEL